MYDAARRAAIHETIMNFPEKYATVVGERGLKVWDINLCQGIRAHTVMNYDIFLSLSMEKENT